MKTFNVTGKCYPEKHYMVDISERCRQIAAMVDRGDYFCINRGRQYGKTTTLSQLKKLLEEKYTVFSISFEEMGVGELADFDRLSRSFLGGLYDALEYGEVNGSLKKTEEIIYQALEENGPITARMLSNLVSKICMANDRAVVLMVDEVDHAGNYPAFIQFLGILRDKYLKRDERATFQSVILASVHDIKNLKVRVRPEEEHQYNSPWNIASEFSIDMDFSNKDIEGMLFDYEKEHQTGMDVELIAGFLSDYTSGYPFLVSRMCKLMDEKVPCKDGFSDGSSVWTKEGFLEALKILLSEENTLFDDMRKKLTQYPELYQMLSVVLYEGKSVPYNIYNPVQDIARIFGYITVKEGRVAVANRIFEIWLYNLFVSEVGLHSISYEAGAMDKNQFIRNGHLDMRLVLERFVAHYTDIYGDREERFHEKEGRKYFMFYLKPIINGTGNYYVEAQTRDETRTDLIVDYRGEQFVIEMKIWRGDAYHTRGEHQLSEYLERFHVKTGYMLSFCFNKNKKTGIQELKIGDKLLLEAVV